MLRFYEHGFSVPKSMIDAYKIGKMSPILGHESCQDLPFMCGGIYIAIVEISVLSGPYNDL